MEPRAEVTCKDLAGIQDALTQPGSQTTQPRIYVVTAGSGGVPAQVRALGVHVHTAPCGRPVVATPLQGETRALSGEASAPRVTGSNFERQVLNPGHPAFNHHATLPFCGRLSARRRAGTSLSQGSRILNTHQLLESPCGWLGKDPSSL